MENDCNLDFSYEYKRDDSPKTAGFFFKPPEGFGDPSLLPPGLPICLLLEFA